jgi:hypothetical protein
VAVIVTVVVVVVVVMVAAVVATAAVLVIVLVDDPTCERYLQEDKSATHIPCDCEAIVYLRFRHLGQLFMEPSDFYDAPINKVLHFILSVINK